jgi:hypothetical protein
MGGNSRSFFQREAKQREIQTEKTMSTDHSQSAKPSESDPKHVPPQSGDYAPYPKLDANDVAPPIIENWSHVPMGSQPQTVNSEARAPISSDAATTMPPESNPYIAPAPVPAPSSVKSEYFRFLVIYLKNLKLLVVIVA